MSPMKIVLTPNPYRDKQFRTVQQAKKILESCGVETVMCLPFDVDRDYELPKTMDFRDLHREIKNADMLVCFGGDGTILHASKIATAHGLPILGVNIGTMGFIAELEAGELELLRKLPTGDYTLEPRSMIDVTVTGANGQKLLHETALNDAVVTKGAIARVVQVSVYCDNVEATSFSGDGVIISTPTGSTAYSFSAGGPVLDAAADVVVLTPVCAHNAQVAPLVFAAGRRLELVADAENRDTCYACADSTAQCDLQPGDVLTVTAAPQKLQLITFYDSEQFHAIENKLMRS